MASYYQPQPLVGDVVDVVGLFIPETGTDFSPSSALNTAEGTSVSRSKSKVTPDDISIAARRNANTFNMCVDAIDYIRKADIKQNRSVTDGRAQLVTTGNWVEAGETIRRELARAFTRPLSTGERIFPTAKDCQPLGLSELDRYNEVSGRAAGRPIPVDTLLAGGELLRLASQMLDSPDAEDREHVYQIFSLTSAFRKQSSKKPYYSNIDDVKNAISEVSRGFAKTYKDKTGADMDELLDVWSKTRETISAHAEELEAARSRAAAEAAELVIGSGSISATETAQRGQADRGRRRVKEDFPKELSQEAARVAAREQARFIRENLGTHVTQESAGTTKQSSLATAQDYTASLTAKVRAKNKAKEESPAGGSGPSTQDSKGSTRDRLRKMRSTLLGRKE